MTQSIGEQNVLLLHAICIHGEITRKVSVTVRCPQKMCPMTPTCQLILLICQMIIYEQVKKTSFLFSHLLIQILMLMSFAEIYFLSLYLASQRHYLTGRKKYHDVKLSEHFVDLSDLYVDWLDHYVGRRMTHVKCESLCTCLTYYYI